MAENKAIHKFKAGDIFNDRYTLEKLIGVGGFADVWKAVDNSTKTTVALKIYTNIDSDGIKDMSDEYARMSTLNHTNILKADHFDNDGNIPYLVMKFCGGGSLDKKVGKITDDEIVKVIRDMAEGLKYLHQNKIVHQDIKPANILIDEHSDGSLTYLLSDFGISSTTKTRLSHSVNLKNQGVSMTEAYAPPEKFSSKKEDRRPDFKGDMFSFGISLYELITGGLPFDELSTGRQLQYGLADVDFSEIHNEKIKRIIAMCMQPAKEDRPSADELLNMIKSEELPRDPIIPGGSGRKTVRVVNQKTNLTWLWVSLLVLALAGLIIFLVLKMQRAKDLEELDVVNEYVQVIDTFTINGYNLEMVKIPGGTFSMGCSDSYDTYADANEKPAQTRQVSDFYMSKYEVTQKLWFIMMNDNPSTVVNDNYPVNNVSWDDCQLFIQKLNALTGRNFRLPTETEWEYAAKACIGNGEILTNAEYKYSGTDAYPSDYAWYVSNSGNTLHQVGQKNPNDLGLYDMSGNVIEWCQDIYTNYSTGNPELDRDQRVLRGGYYSSDASSIRCTSRGSCDYKTAMAPFGFRLCLQ